MYLQDSPLLRSDTCCCTVPWNACQATTAVFVASFVVAGLWYDGVSHSIAWLYTALCVATTALALVRSLVFRRRDAYNTKYVESLAQCGARVPYKIDMLVLFFMVVAAFTAWILGGTSRAPGAIGVAVLYAVATILLARASYRTWLARRPVEHVVLNADGEGSASDSNAPGWQSMDDA